MADSRLQNLGSYALPVSGLRRPEDVTIPLVPWKRTMKPAADYYAPPTRGRIEQSDYLRGTFSILMLDHLNAKNKDWNFRLITTADFLPRKTAKENFLNCERYSPPQLLANTISWTLWWLKTSSYLFIWLCACYTVRMICQSWPTLRVEDPLETL
jgi:hypothetical protein